ncbi:non-structural maintenance of chromosomes element 4 homolog A-like [Oscarella lobularis]|uniref:non-structural maintenance of chromosomes element 4 homolog A-like n=1 Tax=Oscarella lobularis TaxID=121494 RepID=UPI003313353F
MAEAAEDSGNDEWASPSNRGLMTGQYRNVLSDLSRPETRQDYTRPEARGIENSLSDISDLFTKVRDTRASYLDAQALKVLTNYAGERLDAIKTGPCTFDPSVFAEKLISRYGDRLDDDNEEENGQEGSFDWLALGKKVEEFSYPVPVMTHLYGSLDVPPPPAPKKRERKQKIGSMPDSSQKTVPTQVARGEEEQIEGTTREVERIHRVLLDVLRDNDGVVSYWQFVLDPDSFTRTIENVFHLSFLVKEGHVAIIETEDYPLFPWLTLPEEDSDGAMHTKKQAIVTLTMKKWRELKEAFDLKEPLIPPRH